eukprot:TRINITY_DN572_c0_g2_i2.p1 TRINITY_DN572_c0_g2~~TRINITY_DN572_c0_g2_i2.p1  ORF type:complete len:204 (-),score=20.67 TRINITY_DN572_c0_g2_i2:114-725(-)
MEPQVLQEVEAVLDRYQTFLTCEKGYDQALVKELVFVGSQEGFECHVGAYLGGLVRELLGRGGRDVPHVCWPQVIQNVAEICGFETRFVDQVIGDANIIAQFSALVSDNQHLPFVQEFVGKEAREHMQKDIPESQQAQPGHSSPATNSGGEGSDPEEVEPGSEDFEEEGDGEDEVLGGGEMGSDNSDEVEYGAQALRLMTRST